MGETEIHIAWTCLHQDLPTAYHLHTHWSTAPPGVLLESSTHWSTAPPGAEGPWLHLCRVACGGGKGGGRNEGGRPRLAALCRGRHL